MTRGLPASPSPSTVRATLTSSTTQTSRFHRPPRSSSSVVIPRLSPEENGRLCASNLNINPTRLAGVPPRSSLRCNSSSRPEGPTPGPGESDSRSVLDAFFLGKALAEALNERIESTVGEVLSALGTLQSEQQKQVQDFQEEVLERAKKAKEKAAREAKEAQGLVSKSTVGNSSAVVDVATSTNVTSASNETTEAISPSSSDSNPPYVKTDPTPTEKDPLSGVSNDG